MPYRDEALVVVEMWRAVQRRLLDSARGSPDAAALEAEVTRLREEYQRLVDEALRHHRPKPPPFPVSPDR